MAAFSAAVKRFVTDMEDLARKASSKNAVVVIHPDMLRLAANAISHANQLMIDATNPRELSNGLYDAMHDIAVSQVSAERDNKIIDL